jgi:hypothetical protein
MNNMDLIGVEIENHAVGKRCLNCKYGDIASREYPCSVCFQNSHWEPEAAIVRCKDCKHGEIDTAINGVLLSITCDGVKHGPEWFCADGERRDDDA